MTDTPSPLESSHAGHRTRWSRRVMPVVLAGYWLFIFILTHLPAHDLPQVSMSDKLAHFLAYGMLGGLLYLSAWILWPDWKWLNLAVWVMGLSYGAVDEWLQLLVGRDCELNDWLADAAAVSIAVIILGSIRALIRRRAAMAAAKKQATIDAMAQAQVQAKLRREQADARARERAEK